MATKTFTHTTSKGSKYVFPASCKKFESQGVSSMVRHLLKDGWEVSKISKICGLRYQHARNIREDQKRN